MDDETGWLKCAQAHQGCSGPWGTREAKGGVILISVSECKTTGRGAGFALRSLWLGWLPPGFRRSGAGGAG